MSERFSRSLLPNAFDPCAFRVLSRGGQEKLRTHVTVRRSRYFVDGADIVIRQRLKRGNRKKAAPCGAALPSHGCFKTSAKTVNRLFELDGSAGFLDLLLDLLGLFLVDAFLDRLGSAFDQRLGLAEAELGDRADLLDDVDLLATVAGQDHVELGLLFFDRASGSGSGRSGSDSGRSRYAPLLFKRLGQLGGLKDGQFGKLVDQLVDVSHLSHSCAGPRPNYGWLENSD